MRTAVFVERDGILNVERVERGQPMPPLAIEQLQHNPQAIEPLLRLKAAGYLLIATTNQPWVSRGVLPRRELDLMHSILRRTFSLDDIFVCPHDHSEFCPCHKPRPGLLFEASFKWKLNLEHCVVISNKWQDAEAARNAGCTSILVESPWIGAGRGDAVVARLGDVVSKLGKLQYTQAA
ncbi:MAG: family hydrolase [Verrucomicrobiales bacterium]|nr:family hydrolase [Verrucomicrobiales bacterium]